MAFTQEWHSYKVDIIAQIPLGLSCHVSTRLDTFDVSSQSSSSRRACRAVLFDKLDTAKMHHVEHVKSCRDITWQAKWNLGLSSKIKILLCSNCIIQESWETEKKDKNKEQRKRHVTAAERTQTTKNYPHSVVPYEAQLGNEVGLF